MDLSHREKPVERTVTHLVFIRNAECYASCHERWRCLTVTRVGAVVAIRLRSLTGNYDISKPLGLTGWPAADPFTMAQPKGGNARVNSSYGCVDLGIALQDVSMAQAIGSATETDHGARSPLQEVLT